MSSFLTARWVQAESVDSDLSIIDTEVYNEVTGTSQIRFVPKLAHVTGLTSSSTVLCSLNPIVIIGIIQGNIALASV